MFLSIVIPVYNAENHIGSCLDSLLNQDLPPEDYEIICVNDGSKDGTLSVLMYYAEQNANIVILDKENGGVTTARNTGLEIARGDYIWFVDADDLIKEKSLGKLKDLAQNHDRVIFGAYEFTDQLTEEEAALSQGGKLSTNTSFYDSVVWRCLLRREFLKKNGLYFRYPRLTHGEDGLFMYEVTLCDPTAVETEEVIYFYRLHSGSAEGSVTPENRLRRLRSLIAVCAVLKGYHRANKRDSADRLMSFLWMTLYDVTRAPADVAKEALGELKALGLYPCSRPAECTLSQSYMTDPNRFSGKVFDTLYLHLHRPWGYHAMRLLQSLRK